MENDNSVKPEKEQTPEDSEVAEAPKSFEQPIITDKSESDNKDYKSSDFKPKEQKVKRNVILDYYEYKYKRLLVIPLLLVVASVAVLLFTYATTGEFFQKDVSIKELAVEKGLITKAEAQKYLNPTNLTKPNMHLFKKKKVKK